jgi:plasmid maintenance system antidote protein VapI
MLHNDKTMMIDDKMRKKIIEILKGTNYRKVVSERVGCHPNTVSNILNEAPAVATEMSERVELALLEFAAEIAEKKSTATERKVRIKKARAITKQLYTLTKD